jgi:KEOPS complex subunit Cgi121
LIDPCPVLDLASDSELIREFFEVTDAEVAATDATLEDLVIERVSLLVVEK